MVVGQFQIRHTTYAYSQFAHRLDFQEVATQASQEVRGLIAQILYSLFLTQGFPRRKHHTSHRLAASVRMTYHLAAEARVPCTNACLYECDDLPG